MEAVIFLSIIIALFSILVSCFAIRRVKKQIAEITDALIDVKNGNGNRRILSATNELVAPLAYEINEIVVSYESRLSTVRQTEETNRQLLLQAAASGNGTYKIRPVVLKTKVPFFMEDFNSFFIHSKSSL